MRGKILTHGSTFGITFGARPLDGTAKKGGRGFFDSFWRIVEWCVLVLIVISGAFLAVFANASPLPDVWVVAAWSIFWFTWWVLQ